MSDYLRRMLSALVIAGIGCLVPALSSAQNLTKAPIAPDKNGAVNFTVPSNNIECIYTPPGGTPIYKPARNEAELSCDRAQPTYLHFSIGARGPAVMIKNPGEQPCCSDVPVLGYGDTWTQAPFTCSSAQTGLTCKRQDGRGFFISKGSTKTF